MKWWWLVALVACKHTDDCQALRLEAAHAVTAYIDSRFDELHDAHYPELDLFEAANKDLLLVEQTPLVLMCAPIDGLPKSPQPDTAYMDEVRRRLQGVIERASLLIDRHEELGIDVTKAAPRRDELKDLFIKWEIVKTKKGAPWPAAERAYLTAVQDAWCDLAAQIYPQLDAVVSRKKAELVASNAKTDQRLADTTAKQKLVEQAIAVSQQLTSGEPPAATKELHADPAFEPADRLLDRVLRCR